MIQVRESRDGREQAVRTLAFGVMDKGMSDPLYAEVWDPISGTGDFDRHRRHMYVNQIVSLWQMEYELGTITDRHLRTIAREVLSRGPGRRYWASARPFRIAGAGTRRARRFVAILDEEYHATSAAEPSATPAASRADAGRPAMRTRNLAITAVLLGAAGLAFRLLRHHSAARRCS